MLVKIHKSYRDVVTICDDDLIGKKFESRASDDLGKSSEGDKFQLDVKESFFGGDKHSKEEVMNIIQKMSAEDATFNIVGEKAIALALQEGIISEESIKRIDNVPYSLVLV